VTTSAPAVKGGGPSGSAAASNATTTGANGQAARFVTAGPTNRNQLALTFHTSGDVGLVTKLADLLKQRKITATCFLVGTWLEQQPKLAQRLRDDGHEMANHTYSHKAFGSLDHATMAAEVTRCRDAMSRILNTPGELFRPSGTVDGMGTPSAAVLSAAGAAGYHTVLGFDLDPFDYKDPGAAAVQQRVLAALHPGAIVSLHFGHQGTIDALPAVLDAIAAKGLTPVQASKLIA
jgi:peptidoglycan/xylan/chitin deacetylase (PgdA/CDA1 family)